MLITQNYLRYLLEILIQYGGHIDPSVFKRRTKLVKRWCRNWHQCTYTLSPTQTLFSLLLHLDIYLYIYTYIGANENLPRYTDFITPYVYSIIF